MTPKTDRIALLEDENSELRSEQKVLIKKIKAIYSAWLDEDDVDLEVSVEDAMKFVSDYEQWM